MDKRLVHWTHYLRQDILDWDWSACHRRIPKRLLTLVSEAATCRKCRSAAVLHASERLRALESPLG